MQDIFSQLNRIADGIDSRASMDEWGRQYERFLRASDVASRYMRNISSMPSYRRTYFGNQRGSMAKADNIKYARSTYMGLNKG